MRAFFDEVHVVVAVNAAKTPMFSEETRVEIIRKALEERNCRNIKVASTTGLITDYCKKVGATVIVKGLRQNGDYEASWVWRWSIASLRRGNAVFAGGARFGTYLQFDRERCGTSRAAM